LRSSACSLSVTLNANSFKPESYLATAEEACCWSVPSPLLLFSFTNQPDHKAIDSHLAVGSPPSPFFSFTNQLDHKAIDSHLAVGSPPPPPFPLPPAPQPVPRCRRHRPALSLAPPPNELGSRIMTGPKISCQSIKVFVYSALVL